MVFDGNYIDGANQEVAHFDENAVIEYGSEVEEIKGLGLDTTL